MRNKMIDLLSTAGWNLYTSEQVKQQIADHLIANGVTIEEGCERCRGSLEMIVTIQNKPKDGKVRWLGGTLPAKFCPFCGRELGADNG